MTRTKRALHQRRPHEASRQTSLRSQAHPLPGRPADLAHCEYFWNENSGKVFAKRWP